MYTAEQAREASMSAIRAEKELFMRDIKEHLDSVFVSIEKRAKSGHFTYTVPFGLVGMEAIWLKEFFRDLGYEVKEINVAWASTRTILVISW
jgi:hypothetical protein